MDNMVTLTLTSSDNIRDLAYDNDRDLDAEIADWVKFCNQLGRLHSIQVISTCDADEMEDTGVLTGTVTYQAWHDLKGWMKALDPALSDEDILNLLEEAGL